MFTEIGKYRKTILLTVIVSVFMLFPGCEEENSLEPQSEHFEAIGTALYSSGIEVASILRGETEDTLKAPLNALSDHFEVKFYDEDENVIDPPSNEDNSLSWEIDDPGMLEIWQHEGEEGGYEFHLRGLKEGMTHIEFFVMHNEHSDYRSGKFPVVIESQEGAHGEPYGVRLYEEDNNQLLATSYLTTANESVEGNLDLATGETTHHIISKFFDSNNVEFQPGVPPHSLKVESQDSSIATITGLSEDEPWAFKLKGENSGSTEITVYILHDGNIGKTFKPIDVDVN